MSRYVDRIVATIHEAEEALSEDVRDQQKRWRPSATDLVRQGSAARAQASQAGDPVVSPARKRAQPAHHADHLFPQSALRAPRHLGHPVSVDLLSDLRHRSRDAAAVLRDRPSQAWLSECDRESELYVLQLCE